MTPEKNPETEMIEKIEALTLDARNLRQQMEQADTEADREVISKQLKSVEDQIEVLKRQRVK